MHAHIRVRFMPGLHERCESWFASVRIKTEWTSRGEQTKKGQRTVKFVWFISKCTWEERKKNVFHFVTSVFHFAMRFLEGFFSLLFLVDNLHSAWKIGQNILHLIFNRRHGTNHRTMWCVCCADQLANFNQLKFKNMNQQMWNWEVLLHGFMDAAKCIKLESQMKKKKHIVHLIEATRLLDEDSSGHFSSPRKYRVPMWLDRCRNGHQSFVSIAVIDIEPSSSSSSSTRCEPRKKIFFIFNFGRSISKHLFLTSLVCLQVRDLDI